MRKIIMMVVSTVVVLGSCTNHHVSDVELYGNTFIHLSDSDFTAPSDWVEYSLMDSSFTISIPPYMKPSIIDGMRMLEKNEAVFSHNDSVTNGEHRYGRIWIGYFQVPEGTANAVTDYINTYEPQTYKALEQIVDNALGKGPDSPSAQDGVPAGKVINGPFYDCLYIGKHDWHRSYAIDAYYRRGGHTRGKGAVSCHIFIVQNYDEMVNITVSHHDKDSADFKDLFKVIKTFRWKNVKNKFNQIN